MDNRRMCPHCRAFITAGDRVCPYCDAPVGPRAIDVREPGALLGGLIPAAHFTTALILLVNFGLFAATVLYSSRAGTGGLMGLDTRTLLNFGAMFPPYLYAGQWWRLVTAGFLHGGLLHILMNSWALLDLGAQTEECFGTARMLVIYFVAGVAGFWLSARFGHLSVGASASVFGLLGAMIALGLMDRSAMGAAIRSHYMRWAVFGLIMSLSQGIDMAAHVGGLVGGFATAWVAGTPTIRPFREMLWKALAGASIALTLFAFYDLLVWLGRTGLRLR